MSTRTALFLAVLCNRTCRPIPLDVAETLFASGFTNIETL